METMLRVPLIKLLLKMMLVTTVVILSIVGLRVALRHRVILRTSSANELYNSHSEVPLGDHLYRQDVKRRIAKVEKSTARPINVVIVDEHHEVLPYWFQFANEQQAKKGTRTHPSYTVVHVDGHSDFGPLSYKPRLPLFRWPKSRGDITKLMQRNDVFVQAGIGTGLVNRFIWVWPHWTANETAQNFGNHTTGLVHLGTFTYKEKRHAMRTGMCVCMKEVFTDGKPSRPFADARGRDCLFAKIELEPYTDRNVYCNLKVQGIPFDFVRDEHMLKHAKQILPQTSHKQVILDIDEDYFGVQRGSDPLMQAAINWTNIEVINKRLKPLFCPKTVEHEARLSVVIPSLLMSNCSSPLDRSCLSTTESELAIVQRTKCPRVNKQHSKLQTLKEFVKQKFTSAQIVVLNKVGFCLKTSPSTARVALGMEQNSMAVCVGFNEPDSQNGEYYTPTKEVVARDVTRLKGIVDSINNIGLVSIARSNRDGYVPRDLQHLIEKELIGITNSYFQKRQITSNIVYDKNLLNFSLRDRGFT